MQELLSTVVQLDAGCSNADGGPDSRSKDRRQPPEPKSAPPLRMVDALAASMVRDAGMRDVMLFA